MARCEFQPYAGESELGSPVISRLENRRSRQNAKNSSTLIRGPCSPELNRFNRCAAREYRVALVLSTLRERHEIVAALAVVRTLIRFGVCAKHRCRYHARNQSLCPEPDIGRRN